jgi:hypothetical protein
VKTQARAQAGKTLHPFESVCASLSVITAEVYSFLANYVFTTVAIEFVYEYNPFALEKQPKRRQVS